MSINDFHGFKVGDRVRYRPPPLNDNPYVDGTVIAIDYSDRVWVRFDALSNIQFAVSPSLLTAAPPANVA